MPVITTPFVFATGNHDKAREFLELLTAATSEVCVADPLEYDGITYGFVVTALDQRPGVVIPVLSARPEVDETGTTLRANARIKAEGIRVATGLCAIADDTGLAVDALDGAPGVHSARFAGADATYRDNVDRLLVELDRVGATDATQRSAAFTTVVHVAWPDGSSHVVEGAVPGTIVATPRGSGTFGYDPVFVPSEGDGRTFAEMDPDEKHALSHRGRAFRSLLAECSLAFGPNPATNPSRPSEGPHDAG